MLTPENLKQGSIPQSIGIIMDGNRRLAKRFGLNPWKGHEMGVEKAQEVLDWCAELGIKYVTVYAFSEQNFNRPKGEFNMIMRIFEHEFKEIAENPNHKAHKNQVRLKVIGRKDKLPEKVREAVKKAEEATKSYKKYFLNIALAYGGQEEITDACKEISEGVKSGLLTPEKITEKLFSQYLYLNGETPDPDLIIRTGGERRLSNFLLWQSAYTELFFVDEMWPELKKETFFSIIEDYQKRERRFGR
jgi:tritrans,polycis-undecaprenyl-diphosphate synthase [geranylgeranyl-diphosphate specific]